MSGPARGIVGGAGKTFGGGVVRQLFVARTHHRGSLGIGVDSSVPVQVHGVESVESAQEVPGFDDGEDAVAHGLAGVAFFEVDPNRGYGTDIVLFVAAQVFALNFRFRGRIDRVFGGGGRFEEVVRVNAGAGGTDVGEVRVGGRGHQGEAK